MIFLDTISECKLSFIVLLSVHCAINVIIRQSTDGDLLYCNRFSNSDVILSVDQANLLLTDLPTSPEKTVPLVEPNPAKISLGEGLLRSFVEIILYIKCKLLRFTRW